MKIDKNIRHWLQLKSFIIREEIRTGLTYGGVYERIVRGYYPLKRGQINLFNNECEGMCGV